MSNFNQVMTGKVTGDTSQTEHIFQRYQQAAEQGQAQAQYHLALMYQKGQLVPQDDAQAIHWFRKAAEQGVVAAQHQLGLLYKRDIGNPIPDAQADCLAIQWFHSAAEQSHADAQYHLGLMYKVGRGVSRSHTIARYWLRQAAEQGHFQAQETLKLMPPIPMTSRRLFLILSSIGLSGSFFALAGCGGRSDRDSSSDSSSNTGG